MPPGLGRHSCISTLVKAGAAIDLQDKVGSCNRCTCMTTQFAHPSLYSLAIRLSNGPCPLSMHRHRTCIHHARSPSGPAPRWTWRGRRTTPNARQSSRRWHLSREELAKWICLIHNYSGPVPSRAWSLVQSARGPGAGLFCLFLVLLTSYRVITQKRAWHPGPTIGRAHPFRGNFWVL